MKSLATALSPYGRRGIVLVVAAALLTACVDRGAVSNFATTGSDVSTTLAKVYQLIADEAADYEALRNVFVAINGLTRPNRWKPEVLQAQLNNRIEMAQNLGQVYAALAALSSDKTSEDLVSAGKRLGKAFTDAASLVTGAAVPVTSALQAAKPLGGLLAQWKADQDLGQAVKDVAPAPGIVLDLFDDDRASLVAIVDTYTAMLDELGNTMITKGVVRKEDVIKMLSDMYGLTLGSSPCDKLSCDTVATALLSTRTARVSELTKAAINATARALAALASVRMGQPIQDQAGRLQLATQAVTETKTYLTQVEVLRTAPQAGH